MRVCDWAAECLARTFPDGPGFSIWEMKLADRDARIQAWKAYLDKKPGN